MYTILPIHNAFEVSLSELNSLMHQLNPSLAQIDQLHLESFINSDSTKIFGAFNENRKLIGTISVAIILIPSGVRCWIEDVVVDKEYRGIGLGKTLMEHAMEYARTQGVEYIDLTSRPSRIEANELYRKLGFQLRETNVYRCRLR